MRFTATINIDVRHITADVGLGAHYRVQVLGLCRRYGKVRTVEGEAIRRDSREEAIQVAVRKWREVRNFMHQEHAYFQSKR